MPVLLPDEVKYKPSGNSSKDAVKLRETYGDNSLSSKPRRTFLKQYLSAFGDPIIKILLIALALNLIIAIRTADIYEPLGIAVAVFLATFVSTLSEYGSESAFAELSKKAQAETCRAVRDGKAVILPVSELVVYDSVTLCAGERVPADGIVIKGRVHTDQSALNGESEEVEKSACDTGREWSLSNRAQLFRGSVITAGECVMAVGRTGRDTVYGNVANELLSDTASSPLTERLRALAKTISVLGYCAAVLVFVADLFNNFVMDNGFNISYIMSELQSAGQTVHNLLHALTLAITVLVVAVPEGLPMMITVVLSSNMRRLKRDNVLVRKLVGIETGGSLNILFCDKTGTVTKGKLSVTGFYTPDGNLCKKVPPECRQALVLNNESMMIGNKATGGNATDRAILEYAYSREFSGLTVTKRIPFDSQRKYSAVLHKGVWYIKGAPEIIFSKCISVPKELTARFEKLASDGMRVIAFAKSEDGAKYTPLGLLSVSDSLRKDAKSAVKTVRNAGINVCMVTGDSQDTARVIAKNAGILDSSGICITSEDLAKLSDSEVCEILPRLQVVARALPSDKTRLVKCAAKAGLVSGMTGDGINDAPALRHADIGFAMGSGTEVAKEAGDIIILDDSLSAIAKAVLYGRTIFKSIRKFIVFQLTINLCAVGISIIGPFIGVDAPVTVMQMLWVNIIMDTLAGLAFAGEAPLRSYMNERPKKRSEPVLNSAMTLQILSMGLYSLFLCTLFLASGYFRKNFGYYDNSAQYMTCFFALFIFCAVFEGILSRSVRTNIFAGLLRNRMFIGIFLLIIAVQILIIYTGGVIFRTVPIPINSLISVILLAATTVPVNIICKLLSGNRKNY